MPEHVSEAEFAAAFGDLAAIGQDAGGGWRRLAWTAEDARARDWFARLADDVGLDVERDRNGNLWAWWGSPGSDAVVTGSHLDTVPNGGAYDGALGVVSGLLAVRALRRAGVQPRRPVAVVAFVDEEGSRFDTPCLGSRLLTGAVAPEAVLGRRDADGVAMADAVVAAGADPGGFGPDRDRLAAIGAFVELHVEQGRGLIDLDVPLAAASEIRPHGRWHVRVIGETNHAGTTRLDDRHDALLVAAAAVQAARGRARDVGALATIGRLRVAPDASNAVPGVVEAALDARAPDEATLERMVAAWRNDVDAAAAAEGCEARVEQVSRAAAATFDRPLNDRIAALLARDGAALPTLPTGAGHDAGILAARVPTAMLFVRNPSGVSHSPAEGATDADCAVGVGALAAVLADLAA